VREVVSPFAEKSILPSRQPAPLPKPEQTHSCQTQVPSRRGPRISADRREPPRPPLPQYSHGNNSSGSRRRGRRGPGRAQLPSRAQTDLSV